MSLNVVVLTGRLGKDPEVHATSSGKAVAGFTLAVDDGFGDNKKTLWLYCEIWGKRAEALGRLVNKGKRVTVTGRLSEESWTDKQSGQSRSKPKIVVDNIDIIDFIEKEETEEVLF
jgi:single-strand DNA-binding protein